MVFFPSRYSHLYCVNIYFTLIYAVSVSSRPQSYDESLRWRHQFNGGNTGGANNGEYLSQRYYQPHEYHNANIYKSRLPNYDSYDHHRPRMQPEYIPLERTRTRGPAKDVVSEPNSKPYAQNEYNSSYGMTAGNGQADRTDRRFEGASSKEKTRILNSPPLAIPKPVSPNEQNTDFYFPGNIHRPNRTMELSPTSAPVLDPSLNPYIPDISKIKSACMEDNTFCSSAENYPAEYIKSILQKSADTYGDLFGRDEITSNISISTRIDLTIDGTPMCGSKEQVIEPPVGRNKDNEWKYIVNAGPYVQGIRVEMCERPGKACAMSENFPLAYTTECKQKYIYRKLLALESNGKVEPDTFRLPSCCTCIYRQDPVARLGINPSFGTSLRRK